MNHTVYKTTGGVGTRNIDRHLPELLHAMQCELFLLF